MDLLSVTSFARQSVVNLQPHPRIALDATAGNGNDTLFLCELVAEQGLVLALDIQAKAVEQSEALLREKGLLQRARVLCNSHANLEQILSSEKISQIDVAMYNLGYLPGADKSCVTQSDTTIHSLDQCLNHLSPGGVISICAYVAHPGGEHERDAVEFWVRSLPSHLVRSVHYASLSTARAPECFIVQRKFD